MEFPGSDPFEWSTKQVHAHLAATTGISLADVLRRHEIDGRALLAGVTTDVLRDDLRIFEFGRRHKIMWEIQRLRQRSAMYQDYILQQAAATPLPVHNGFVQPMRIPDYPTVLAVGDGGSGRGAGGVAPASPSCSRNQLPAIPNGRGCGLAIQESARSNQGTPPLGLLARSSDSAPLVIADPFALLPGNTVRVQVEDDGISKVVPYDSRWSPTSHTSEQERFEMEDGMSTPRPIRRIKPVPLPGASDGDVNMGDHAAEPEEDAVAMELDPPVPAVRGISTQTSDHQDRDGLEGRSLLPASRWRKTKTQPPIKFRKYLSRKAMEVDTIFYGDVEMGEEIPVWEEETDNWCIVSSHTPPGGRQFVHRQLKHFLSKSESVAGTHNGRKVVAIKPYRYFLLKRHQKQSITVFSATPDGTCVARRQDIEQLRPDEFTQAAKFFGNPEEKGPWIDPEDNSDHAFDYLIKWENIPDDHQLPALGDSDAEDEYDPPTSREIEAKVNHQPNVKAKPPLTSEEARDIMDQYMDSITEKWREKRLPRLEARAWKLWRNAKKNRRRKLTIANSEKRLEELKIRLQKMMERFDETIWKTAAELRVACSTMEVSLMEREESNWMIELMKRKHAPRRPSPIQRPDPAIEMPGVHEQPQADGEDEGDDEETIGSQSSQEYTSEDEGLGGFIVDDNVRDFTHGTEIEVEGEQEVLEELARQQEDANVMDTEESDSEPITTRRRRLRKGKDVGKSLEEGELEVFYDAQEAPGDDDTGVGAHSGNNKEKQRAVSTPDVDTNDEDKAPPSTFVKVQPSMQLAPVTPNRKDSRDIPVIDLTMDDSPPSKEDIYRGKSSSVKPVSRTMNRRKSSGPAELVALSDSEEPKVLKATLEKVEKDKTWESANELLEELWESLTGDLKESLKFRFATVKTLDELFSVIKPIMQQLSRKKSSGIPGLNQNSDKIYREIAKLYACWALRKIPNFSKPLDHKSTEYLLISNRFKAFCSALQSIMDKNQDQDALEEDLVEVDPTPTATKRKRRQSVREGRMALDESEEYDEPTLPIETGKKRRRLVQEDASAREKRDRVLKNHRNHFQRVRRQLLANSADNGEITINVGHYAKYKDINFHPLLRCALKQHQIDGVRFIWRQLVAAGDNTGALLAHTMGLGKTLQVIAFLYTLATASGSGDPAVVGQIPQHLRKSRTLILSPPGLVENWEDEFHKWIPSCEGTTEMDISNLGQIRRADSTKDPDTRLRTIRQWYDNGGVLLMGYHTFRDFIDNPIKKRAGSISSTWPSETHREIKKMLHEGPNIIVADEAHTLKNDGSKVSRAAADFQSKSRIAITGSPLMNNIMEYYAMIDWIDPGYLGSKEEFRLKYEGPIQNGMYMDSALTQRRHSLKLLKALSKNLEPKVHRAGIEDIVEKKDALPGKTEFMVCVPLMPLQLQMYLRYIEDPTTRRVEKSAGTRDIFDVVHLLRMIGTHPQCFVGRLEGREKEAQKEAQKVAQAKTQQFQAVVADKTLPKEPSSNNEEHSQDADENIVRFKFLEPSSDELLRNVNRPYPWARQVFDAAGNGDSIEHSAKMMALKLIIEFSIEASDQILVFSHHINTLDLLERFIKEWGVSYRRLDGKTKMSSRQESTKEFNKGDSSVFLISTEAGSLGLNLPGANRVVIFDFSWTPMAEEQAVGRAYRLGQKKHVFVYRFYLGGTFEEIVHNKVLFKNQLQSRVVDQKDPIRKSSKNLKEYLNPPREIPQEDLMQHIGKDPLVLDRVIQQVDFIRAIHFTETFEPDLDDILTEEEEREALQLYQEELGRRRGKLGNNAWRSDLEGDKTLRGAPAAPVAQMASSSAVMNTVGNLAGNPPATPPQFYPPGRPGPAQVKTPTAPGAGPTLQTPTLAALPRPSPGGAAGAAKDNYIAPMPTPTASRERLAGATKSPVARPASVPASAPANPNILRPTRVSSNASSKVSPFGSPLPPSIISGSSVGATPGPHFTSAPRPPTRANSALPASRNETPSKNSTLRTRSLSQRPEQHNKTDGANDTTDAVTLGSSPRSVSNRSLSNAKISVPRNENQSRFGLSLTNLPSVFTKGKGGNKAGG